MNFSTEFKQECFNVFQFNTHYTEMAKALEANDAMVFRFAIEAILDELGLSLEPRIIVDEGDMLVWNSMVGYWFKANRVYADFMDMWLEEDEKENEEANLEIQSVKRDEES